MEKLLLNGKCRIYSADGKYSCTGNIPGSDFGAFIKGNIISDPLISENCEAIVNSVASRDYIFEKNFDVSDSLFSYEHIDLRFDKLDTLASVYINDTFLGQMNNAYREYSFDIKGFLKSGSNTLTVKFRSALEYIERKQKENPLPKNPNGVNGAAYIRKPACHFGWDWGPCVPYNYVGNTSICCYNTEIKNISVKQETSSELSVVTASADGAEEIYIISPSGDRIDSDNGTFYINNPSLWYTRDLSGKDKQPLYTVVFKNSEITAEKKIGLRSITLDTEDNGFGKNFMFRVNGERVFAKGANLVPYAAIPEYGDKKRIDELFDICLDSGFNMIRVWGGGEYADEYLLSKCDEKGVLVWQDMCFACLMYPLYENGFEQNVLTEIEENIKRLRLHPSLALICGNNELEAMYSYLPGTMKIVKAYVEFFYNKLPPVVKRLCDTPYIPTSPVGNEPFKNNSADNAGDNHMWNVWHGLMPLDYYSTRYAAFLSEFGLESLPSMKSIERFSRGSRDLFSEEFMSHQKCTGGNEKMLYYLCEKFSRYVPFEYLPYLTGIVQAECIKSATEHFRRNKGRCSGSLFWQLNDVWDAPSWSGVDFQNVPKAVMYMARDFFAPVTLTFKDGLLYVHNDTLEEEIFNITVSVFRGKKQVFEKSFGCVAEGDSVKPVFERKLSEGEVMRVFAGEKVYYFDNCKKLENAFLRIRVKENTVTVKTDVYTKNIYIDAGSNGSDNYFSLMPGEEKTVVFSEKATDVKVICENNIDFSKKKLRKAMFRFFYRLKPLNIGNYMYYRFN